MFPNAFNKLGVVSCAFLFLVTGFSVYALLHEDDYVRIARDKKSSEARAREDAARDFLQGSISVKSYIGAGDKCVTPIVTNDQLQQMYPSAQVGFSYHGLCWWLKRRRASTLFYEHNGAYATVYNASMLHHVHLAHWGSHASSSQ